MSWMRICSLFAILAVFSVGGNPNNAAIASFSAPVCTSVTLDVGISGSTDDYLVRLRLNCYETSIPGYTSLDVLTLFKNISDIFPLDFFDEKLFDYIDYEPMVNIADTSSIQLIIDTNGIDVEAALTAGFFDGTMYFNNRYFDPVTKVCANVYSDDSITACCSNFKNVNYAVPNEVCSAFSVQSDVRYAIENSTLAVFRANFTLLQDKIIAKVTEFSSHNYNYLFGVLHYDNVNKTTSGATLVIPFDETDALFDVQLRLNNDDDPAYTNRIVSLTQRKRNWYWGKNTVLTRANPCMQWQEYASNNPDAIAYTSICCSTFSANLNPLPVTTTPAPTTASPLPPGWCAEYRSITTVNWNGFNLNHLNVKYVFDGSVLNVEMQNFTSSKPGQENAQLEAYSTDTFTQTCSTTSNGGSVKCSWRLSDTSKYEFQLRTATYANGFNMFLGVEQNRQFTSPYMKPCHLETNALNGGMDGKTVAVTEICCISTPNGPWPGTTQLDAPLIWPL